MLHVIKLLTEAQFILWGNLCIHRHDFQQSFFPQWNEVQLNCCCSTTLSTLTVPMACVAEDFLRERLETVGMGSEGYSLDLPWCKKVLKNLNQEVLGAESFPHRRDKDVQLILRAQNVGIVFLAFLLYFAT